MSEIIKKNFHENLEVSKVSIGDLLSQIELATQKVINMIDGSGKLLSCGNGGSSGDAQHIASELVNRFEKERKEVAAVSLSSDTATITSIANDYEYKYIFSKQINAIGKKGDLLVAFTTSGNSENICEAIHSAQKIEIPIILITGKDGGSASKLLSTGDIEIRVPSNRTSRIQEIHLVIIHSICECVDSHLC
ncbi:MAG: SIS domain-containing protein [Pseudomonadota bacterium]|nr:SIS domain-containing protein [Pseudomonadota bacterium]